MAVRLWFFILKCYIAIGPLKYVLWSLDFEHLYLNKVRMLMTFTYFFSVMQVKLKIVVWYTLWYYIELVLSLLIYYSRF